MEVRLLEYGYERFKTPRAEARRIHPSDLSFLTKLHSSDSGAPELTETTKRFLQANLAHWRRFQFGMWVISEVESGVQVGRAALRLYELSRESAEFDASCLLLERFRDRGLGTEILRAVVAIGVNEGINVVAQCEAENTRARRIIEKNGLLYSERYTVGPTTWVKYVWPAGRGPNAEIIRA